MPQESFLAESVYINEGNAMITFPRHSLPDLHLSFGDRLIDASGLPAVVADILRQRPIERRFLLGVGELLLYDVGGPPATRATAKTGVMRSRGMPMRW